MRLIIFRGKRKANNEWVVGNYFYDPDLEYNHIMGFDYYNEEGIQREFFDVEVIPETVGQYTGLTDKNGKKIFEGDIIEGHCHSQWSHRLQRCVVAYERDGFEARHYVMQGGEERYYTYKVLFSKDVVVIGNITDNPELLKGDENNE